MDERRLWVIATLGARDCVDERQGDDPRSSAGVVGKLTDDDLEQIDGKRDKLVALLQARDGDSREKAEEELDRLAAA